jgi:hypothetical protein
MPQGILGSSSYREPTPDQSLTVPRDPLGVNVFTASIN